MPMPRISCILVHEPGRTSFTAGAIAGFHEQTYANKELRVVVVGDGDDMPYSLPADVTVFHPTNVPNRGALLDAAQREASGPLICRWEASCRHHPRRLEVQFGMLGGSNVIGSCISDQLFIDRDRVWWLDYASGIASGGGGMIADTLLHWRRNCVQHAADGNAMAFFQSLTRFGAIAPVTGSPYLTARRCPTGDPDAVAAFREEVKRRAVSSPRLLNMKDTFTRELPSVVGWSGLHYSVCDANGPVYGIDT